MNLEQPRKSFFKRNWWKISIGFVGIVILFLLFVFIRPETYLPHKHIVIGLPFAPEYDARALLTPMGETIYHPKPQVPAGHPGIDFAWPSPVPIISSSDGKVIQVVHENSGLASVTVKSSVYELRYKELAGDTLGNNIKNGAKIKTGDFIGNAGPGWSMGTNGEDIYGIHWEFGSPSLIRDRFCPLTYFDLGSLSRINKILFNHPLDEMKQNFPDICSGDYKDKTD